MRYLEKAGYQVDLVTNGRQAVDACKQKRYDLILMDIQMPIMDGLEATKEIRGLEKKGKDETAPNESGTGMRVPIIAMTAHDIDEFRQRCLEIGMDDFVAKPLKRKELITMIDAHLGARILLPHEADHNREFGDAGKEEGFLQEDMPIDFQRAMKEFEGDRTFLMDLLDEFIKNVSVQIESIHSAISQGDADKVRAEAHSIKGGAGNICAYKLSDTAFALEMAGTSGMLKEGEAVLEKLEKEFHRLENYADAD